MQERKLLQLPLNELNIPSFDSQAPQTDMLSGWTITIASCYYNQAFILYSAVHSKQKIQAPDDPIRLNPQNVRKPYKISLLNLV